MYIKLIEQHKRKRINFFRKVAKYFFWVILIWGKGFVYIYKTYGSKNKQITTEFEKNKYLLEDVKNVY